MGAVKREKPADAKKRKGAKKGKRETNATGREEKASLPTAAARISRRRLLGEQDAAK